MNRAVYEAMVEALKIYADESNWWCMSHCDNHDSHWVEWSQQARRPLSPWHFAQQALKKLEAGKP